MRLKIAARKSDLARLQAYFIAEQIEKIDPSITIEFSFRESLGDKNLTDPLWKIPQKGVFTEDFYLDLVEGKADLVVHSWKDLATEEKQDTMIVATLPRADERDILLVKSANFERIQEKGLIRLFSSSPRRLFHLPRFCREFLPLNIQDCEFESVRGNIPTRLRKLITTEAIDGLVMAKAALDRLLQSKQPDIAATRKSLVDDLSLIHWTILPLQVSPPAPAQGAIAVEIRRDRSDLLSLFGKLNDLKTFSEAQEEREILQKFGGGCHQKIGVSSKHLKQGRLLIASGEHQGSVFYQKEFKPQFALHQKFLENEILCLSSGDVFHTETLDYQLPPDLNALEIVKSHQITAELKNFQGVLWTSGLETWKQLAQKGLWIHGTQESLGENSLSRPQFDFFKPLKWGKLSHENKKDYVSEGSEFHLKIIETYRLLEKSPLPHLGERKCFYWKSYSLFKKAVSEQPDLLEKIHCCGPGQTAEFIEKHLLGKKRSPKVFVFLDETDWRNQVCLK